jgi:glycosyltransferase involved in cell wall biosynthesis
MTTLLSINNYHYQRGGAESVFLEQNRLFRESGCNVVPFSMHHPKNSSSEWENYFINKIEFGDSYSLKEKALNSGKVIFSFEARRKLAALIDAIRPDVAHAHNVYHHISPSIFSLLKQRGIPTVLTLHDLKIACPAYKMLAHDGVCERCKGGKLWNVVQHRCLKNSTLLSALAMVESSVHRLLGCYSRNIDRFIVPSLFYQEKLIEWGWPRGKFVHIPNFVDTARLVPKKGGPGSAFVYIGRLSPEKGLATFIQAAALAGVEAWIVGSGAEERSLIRLVQDCGADVKFFGHRSADALWDLIRKARCLVLPSEWYENAPMSVMEAYALERPVIGARIGGIPELVREGETGALFESGNINALARALRHVSDQSDANILEMGKAGRAWMTADFSANQYVKKLKDLYNKLGVAT